MLVLFLLLIWRSVATVHGYIQTYAPPNILLSYLRTRRGLKWAVPVGVIAVPVHLHVAWLMTALVDEGASEWLYGVMLVAFLYACKFGALALYSPVLLVRAHGRHDAESYA